MSIFLGKIQKTGKVEGITLGTQFNYGRFHDWAEKHQGKVVRIELREPISINKRRFFEGAVVHYFFYQHGIGVFKDFSEARECLKREFNPVFVKRLDGSVETQGGSTEKKSNEWFGVFLEKIQDYFMQQGYEFPDPEQYKKWVESAPLPGEVYPPLERLIEIYKKQT